MDARAIAMLVVLLPGCSGSTRSAESEDGSGGGANQAGAESGGSSSKAGASSGGSGVAGDKAAGGSSSGSPSGGGAAGPRWAEWAACQVAEDCTVVPIESCCGCMPTGVNKQHEAEAKASNAGFNFADCPPLGCASPGCPADSMVVCEQGMCLRKAGCSERDEQGCEADDKCEKYQARLCTMPGEFHYFACGKPKGACDSTLTCRVNPNGQQVLFPDSCVPDGHTQECVSQCQ